MNIQGDFIARLNWPDIATQLDREGYAVLHSLLKDSQVHELAALRGTACADDRVSLTSEGLGRGHLFYFLRPLPAFLEEFADRVLPTLGTHRQSLEGHPRYFPSVSRHPECIPDARP